MGAAMAIIAAGLIVHHNYKNDDQNDSSDEDDQNNNNNNNNNKNKDNDNNKDNNNNEEDFSDDSSGDDNKNENKNRGRFRRSKLTNQIRHLRNSLSKKGDNFDRDDNNNEKNNNKSDKNNDQKDDKNKFKKSKNEENNKNENNKNEISQEKIKNEKNNEKNEKNEKNNEKNNEEKNEINIKGEQLNKERICGIYTYGCPQVGNKKYIKSLGKETKKKHFRYVNNNDFVPSIRIPSLKHLNDRIYISTNAQLHFGPSSLFLWSDRIRGVCESLTNQSISNINSSVNDLLFTPDCFKDHLIESYFTMLIISYHRFYDNNNNINIINFNFNFNNNNDNNNNDDNNENKNENSNEEVEEKFGLVRKRDLLKKVLPI